MRVYEQAYLTLGIWTVLVLVLVAALVTGNWSLAFVAGATLILSFAPLVVESRIGVRLPIEFVGAIVLFIFATIFLGEAFDFYERYWWWDLVLHSSSAMGFSMIGIIFVLVLFEGDKYAAPPWALSLLAFCVAVAIGAIWEIFEFLMDTFFGLNMQKSGLGDTMTDLMVDSAGAAVGAVIGYAYLVGSDYPMTALIRKFVESNRRLFRRRDRGE